MTDYTGRTPTNYKDPYVLSEGAYKVATDEAIYMNIPVKVSGAGTGTSCTGTQDSDDGNKVYVTQYSDVGGTESCLGIPVRNMYVLDDDPSNLKSVGMGDRRRDILIVHRGSADVNNVSIEKTFFGQLVSPHPSGFQAYASGMQYLGYVLEPGVGSGYQCKIFVEPREHVEWA